MQINLLIQTVINAMKEKEVMKEYNRDLTKLEGLGRCSWKNVLLVERVILTKNGEGVHGHNICKGSKVLADESGGIEKACVHRECLQ